MRGERAAIVLDNSSSKTKAGFAGDDGPRAVFSSEVGRRKNYGICTLGATALKDVYVGDEVEENVQRHNLMVRKPVQDGLIVNWDDMEHIWHHAFYSDLKVEPEGQPLLITDRFLPRPAKGNREMMTQVVFETFNVPAFYPCYAEVSSMYMYTCETTTAVRIHSNDTSTTIIPIMDGIVLQHAATRVNIGGRDITSLLQRLLSQRGHSLDTETVRDIKHQLCYLALDPDIESDPDIPWIEQPYKLPDGRIISIGQERFEAPDIIFGSSQLNPSPSSLLSLQEDVFRAISKCDKSVRSQLTMNLILSGGNTRFPGHKERMAKGVGSFPPPEGWLSGWSVNVTNRSDEKNAAWIGGSILASLSTFQSTWVSKAEYDEVGPTIVRRKCF